MTKAKLNERERDILRDYHIPGCQTLWTRASDEFHFSINNTIEHERKKFEVAFGLLKAGQHFIMEAERNKKDEAGNRRIVDVVSLSTGDEYEIETDPARAERFLKDPAVTIVPVGWSKEDEGWKRRMQKFKESH